MTTGRFIAHLGVFRPVTPRAARTSGLKERERPMQTKRDIPSPKTSPERGILKTWTGDALARRF